MFIAHLPAGYLLAKTFKKNILKQGLDFPTAMIFILIGAVFPDLDLFYFYFIDGRSVHHHQYFMHWPLFWIGWLLIIYLSIWLNHHILKSCHAFKFLNYVKWFIYAVLLHISLDTFVGDIWLLAPFIFEPFVFFEVTPRFQPWWLNFILHWSFAVELIICLIALYLFKVQRREN